MSANERLGSWRAEEKYILPPGQQAVFLHRLKALMHPDAHAEHGTYTIHSLYFDNYDNSCYTQVLDGLNHRAKYRLRYYGQDTTHIFLEKRKNRQAVCERHPVRCLTGKRWPCAWTCLLFFSPLHPLCGMKWHSGAKRAFAPYCAWTMCAAHWYIRPAMCASHSIPISPPPHP